MCASIIMRYTAATMMVIGVVFSNCKKDMGHSGIELTMRSYTNY